MFEGIAARVLAKNARVIQPPKNPPPLQPTTPHQPKGGTHHKQRKNSKIQGPPTTTPYHPRTKNHTPSPPTQLHHTTTIHKTTPPRVQLRVHTTNPTQAPRPNSPSNTPTNQPPQNPIPPLLTSPRHERGDPNQQHFSSTLPHPPTIPLKSTHPPKRPLFHEHNSISYNQAMEPTVENQYPTVGIISPAQLCRSPL